MLDNLYENIGGKIKSWAKWIFIVEAIGAIITGIYFVHRGITASFDSEPDILLGFLILLLGPIVAWVSTWLLYAFGELVEDVHELRVQGSLAPVHRSTNNKTKTQRTAANTTTTKQKNDSKRPDNDEYIDVLCPNCEEQLSFLKGEANAVCPCCDTKIDLKQ